ncbi:hypothetical protein CPB86DRAFT_783152 [Serendipita vermifera]|nr:hypothetical protein CPB86DRAFT_783152 [Serendipita vermifera]
MGLIDTLFHWLELIFDFCLLLITLPYHMLMSWWENLWTKKEPTSPIKQKVEEVETEEEEAKEFKVSLPTPLTSTDSLATTVSKELPSPTLDPDETVSAANIAAIEAHRKEQEAQEKEAIKLQELQERSARDRAAHLRRVAGPPPSAMNNNNNTNSTSRTLQATMKSNKAASSSDLPASALNLPKGPVVNSKEPYRIHVPQHAPPAARRNSRSGGDSGAEESRRPNLYPIAALAMPVPVRAQRAPAKPAVHLNMSSTINRPSNPAPQVPSVVVPLSQTMPRPPRTRPPPHLLSQTAGGKSSDTLTSGGSSVSEFGITRNTHRREGATDDETADGESQESGGKAQRWEDFMEALARPGQSKAAAIPSGTSGLPSTGGNIHLRRQQQAKEFAAHATRGPEEIVERIANMKREVDEKLKNIAERSPGMPASAMSKATVATRVNPTSNAIPLVDPAVLKSRNRVVPAVRPATRTKATTIKMEVDSAIDDATTIASSSNTVGAGTKRHRKPAVESSDSLTTEDEEAKRSPKKRKVDLETESTMEVDDKTIATDSAKVTRRSTRTVNPAVVKGEPPASTAVPADIRTGTSRSTRTNSQKPAEQTVIPSVATRTRSRRAVVS